MKKVLQLVLSVLVLLTALPLYAQQPDASTHLYLPAITVGRALSTTNWEGVVATVIGCGQNVSNNDSFCPQAGNYSMLKFSHEQTTLYYMGKNDAMYVFSPDLVTELFVSREEMDVLELVNWPSNNEVPKVTNFGASLVVSFNEGDLLNASQANQADPALVAAFFTKLTDYLSSLTMTGFIEVPATEAFQTLSGLSYKMPSQCGVPVGTTTPIGILGGGYMAPMVGANMSVHVKFFGERPDHFPISGCMKPHEYLSAESILLGEAYASLRQKMKDSGYNWENVNPIKVVPVPGLVYWLSASTAQQGGVLYTLQTTLEGAFGSMFMILPPGWSCFIETGTKTCRKEFDPTR